MTITKKISCVLLAVFMIISFSSCSGHGNDMTEENVNYTVGEAVNALQKFDADKLEKYVDSQTLSYIISYAKGHDQFKELGKAIFANLDVEVKSIDLDAKTVTISVKNKDLYDVASNFASNLLSTYTKLQLLSKLSNDDWLDTNLTTLTKSIDEAQMSDKSVDVTLTIEQGSKNLILSFDDNAENAVSGGALNAIKGIA